MGEVHRKAVFGQVSALFRAGTFAGMSDGELLEHFLGREAEAGELAFAALVERHGPTVLRICRRGLGDGHDAEDAFQATFLALARSARSIRRRESVGCWLLGAAHRVSASARVAGARRRKHERRFAAGRAGAGLSVVREPGPDDVLDVLHEELARLRSPYREAVALCDLEGLALDEAARRLGCPVGTLKSRLSRGRDRLRDRLTRRGLAPPSAPAVVLALARKAPIVVRPGLVDATIRASAQLVAGRGLVGMLAAAVEALVYYEARRMVMRRIGLFTATLAAAGVLAVGVGGFARQEPKAGGPTAPRPADDARDKPRDKAPAEPPKPVRAGRYAKTYVVADLVTPPRASGDGQADMGPLIDLLTSSVAPGTWTVFDESGYPVKRTIEGSDQPAGKDEYIGSIIPFRLSLSLIVRHTPEAHEELGRRLAQLRKVLAARETTPRPAAEDLDDSAHRLFDEKAKAALKTAAEREARAAAEIQALREELHRLQQGGRAEPPRQARPGSGPPSPSPQPRPKPETAPAAAPAAVPSAEPADPTRAGGRGNVLVTPE